MKKVKLFESDFDDEDARAVQQVVAEGWLTNGPHTIDFEAELARLTCVNSERVSVVSSCTAALHLALMQAGIGGGDEVIVPALTFVSDFNIVRAVGATPVFCDVESAQHWAPSVVDIERVLTQRTRAVIITHFAGIPARHILAIKGFCAQHGLVLIEDCAHSLGAKISGVPTGTIGDFGAFSFYSNKNISTGEGGALVCVDGALSKMMRSHGMTTSTLDREKGRAFSYDVARAGLNYRIDEMRSVLGRRQLEKFQLKHEIRKKIVNLYSEIVSNSALDSPHLHYGDDIISVDHIMPVLLPIGSDRGYVMRYMLERGIQTSIHYPPPWTMTAYAESCDPHRLTACADICDRELTLPLHTKLSTSDVEFVMEKLLEAL